MTNFDQAARRVIRDYLDGKMSYFTPAPHMEGFEEEESTGMLGNESMME